MLLLINKLINFPKGIKLINIEIAILGYEALTQVFTLEYSPEQWVYIQQDLAIAYRNRIYGDHKSNIEKAIKCYEELLDILDKDNNFYIWITTSINISLAYSYRIAGSKVDNLEKAIDYCQQILEVCNTDNSLEDWIHTKRNLGNFYRDRIYGNPIDNLEVAISHYKDILPVLNKDLYTEFWLTVQSGLGLCYCNRLKGDALENTEIAIEYFKQALQVCNPKDWPVNWVNIHNNLGIAYFQRQFGTKSENIELAIECLTTALQVASFESMPEQWAMSNINLGSSYNDRIQGDKIENIKIAIKYFQAAAKVYNYKDYPQNWTTLHNNLGVLYGRIGSIEEQIKCFQTLLEICTREQYPYDWAQTHYNLGLAYRKMGLIDEAIASFRLSLEIFQPSLFPVDSRLSGRDLGKTAFKKNLWIEAIEGYSIAIEALETSRTWIKSESRRQEILADSIDIYQNIVQAYINIKQIDKAFEYSERSRSQRLVELMASSHLSQSENIPPKIQDLLQKYEELQQQIDIERQNYKSENNRSEIRALWQAYNEKIALLEIAKQEIWEQLRREDPILAGEIQVEPLSLSEIQQLIDNPKTAILSFYTTNSDTNIFIITQKSIYLHTCIEEGLETLQNWIKHHWSSPYQEYVEKKFKNWEYNMENFLHQLAERLQLSKIIHQYLQDIEELIIEPHLLLHQIPFAALPTEEYQECLVDRFLIRYTPSCQILDFCHQNHKKKRLNLDSQDLQYGTVADTLDNKPLLSLPFSRWEEEEIAKLYNIPSEKRLIGSSQSTVENFRKLAGNVQNLHCCHHATSYLYNPLESELNLGDGSITLGQLMSPGWRLPNLVDVFLSCCETNLGKPNITDDLLTLSTGFLCAGATNVISSLWMVDDLATALLSIFYYQERQTGKNRPQALKQAQIKLRELRKADLEEICKELRKADLEEISQAAENQRQQARNQKKQYPQDSAEYLECDRQHQKYAKISIAINNIQKSKGEFPFAHPRYWSAFIAQGLQ
ncbi:CHAT domain-containing protein [Dolichospermum sp. UHCC 0259]|nr:CHAT domain-containing protein [Dolichospermum sp. UHCC 0259]